MTQDIQLKNGQVLVSVTGYSGEEDFYLMFDIIKELHRAGTTILLVEQNAQMALSVADRGYVLETGRVTLTGPGRELLADEAVKKAYLGG